MVRSPTTVTPPDPDIIRVRAEAIAIAAANNRVVRFGPAAPIWLRLALVEAQAVAAGQRLVHGLTYTEFAEAYRTIFMANCCGVYADFRVDITWQTLGIVGEAAVIAALLAFIEKINRWCLFRYPSFAIIAVLEVGDHFGLHSHLQIAIPVEDHDQLERFCQSTLRDQVGCDPIDTPNVKTMFIQKGSRSLDTQWARLRYMCKGASRYASLPWRVGDLGLVPLFRFAGIGLSNEGQILGQRLYCMSRFIPPQGANVLPLPDMSVRIDGPQLYQSTGIDWHRKVMGKPHFEGGLALRDARHLMAINPFRPPVPLQI